MPAGLTLRPAAEARRQIPFPGAGVLRPMWDTGLTTPAGDPGLLVARVWVEELPFLGPGGRATVRLAPLTPSRWRHLRPGRTLLMHEDRTVAGTAVVVEVARPSPPEPA